MTPASATLVLKTEVTFDKKVLDFSLKIKVFTSFTYSEPTKSRQAQGQNSESFHTPARTPKIISAYRKLPESPSSLFCHYPLSTIHYSYTRQSYEDGCK
jgi:hypothetical protein